MRWLLLLPFLPGCARGCVGSATPEPQPLPAVDAAHPSRPMLYSEQCVAEIDRPSIAVLPQGATEVDQLVATCRDTTLGLYFLRGHTLARTTRTTALRATWSAPTVLSPSADRLGPVDPTATDGPLAWRTPTLGTPDEHDNLWRYESTRTGDLLLPVGTIGLGAPTTDGDAVLAGFVRQGTVPFLGRVTIPLGRPTPTQSPTPASLGSGELLAHDHAQGVSLLRMEDADGRWLVARFRSGATQRVAMPEGVVNVHPRGVSVGTSSVFLVGELVEGRDGGRCLDLGSGHCVEPRAVSLLIATSATAPLSRITLAARGIPDALASSGTTVTALWVTPSPGDDTTAEHAAEITLPAGIIRALTLTAPPGVEALEGAALTTCADALWIAFPTSAPTPGGPRAAVMALPWSCVAR